MPVRKFAGYPKSHPKSLVRQAVDAVGLDLMMVSRDVFASMNGFNTTYGDRLSYADFCLRVQDSGKAVVYAPDGVAMNFEGEENEPENDDGLASDPEALAFKETYVVSGI